MSAAMAAEFREDVLLFEDWTADDYSLAESLADVIEFDAASYDSQTRIVSISMEKILSLVASGATKPIDAGALLSTTANCRTLPVGPYFLNRESG
jgi:hypothetical protein